VGSLKISKDWKLAGDQESIGAERAIMIAVLEFWSFPGDQKLVFIILFLF
jgi:hypothetical protein